MDLWHGRLVRAQSGTRPSRYLFSAQNGPAAFRAGTMSELADTDADVTRPDPAKLRVFLIGPTASGKNAVAEAVAASFGCRLLSMDSMAVFKHMDIGTAKPPPERRHLYGLIDLVPPREDYSVARYVAAAEDCVRQSRDGALVPLFVGGTALYYKALVYGLFDGPPADWEVRTDLRRQEAEQGPGYLHAELARVDPDSARKLHPNDTKRLIRALEVYRTSGVPISKLQKEWMAAGDPNALVFEITREREDLYARIERRVESMFDEGLIGETERIRDELGGFGKQASQGLGYREVLEHLSGARAFEETVELVKRNTRRFAKRQLTWFRGFADVVHLAARPQAGPESLAEVMVARLEALSRR